MTDTVTRQARKDQLRRERGRPTRLCPDVRRLQLERLFHAAPIQKDEELHG